MHCVSPTCTAGACLSSHAVPQVSSRRGWCLSNGEQRARRGDKGRMSNWAGNQRRENDRIYFCSGIQIVLMALVGGELFRGSGEQGGLSTARRAADCRSLVRCLLTSFLLSTSLPACPACVHGLRQKKWPEMMAETIQMHTYTSYLHISCMYAYLHKTSYLTAQNDTYCMLILFHVVAWFYTEFLSIWGIWDRAMEQCVYTLDLVNEKSSPIATIIEFVPYLSSVLMRC